MDILIHADGLTLTDDLKAVIDEKIGRLEQFAPRAVRARVSLRRMSAHPSPRQYHVRVLCEIPGRDLSAAQSGRDSLSALDVVAVKLERLLRKRKTEQLARRESSPRQKEKA